MAKDYAFDEVKPEMKGGINYWSKVLGMGTANIRTAIRNKTLKATLEPLSEKNPTLVGYQITGQQIMDWRANSGHRANGEAGEKESRTNFVFKTSEKITQEVADQANVALAAAGITFTLTRAAKAVVKKGKEAPAVDAENEMPVMTEEGAARLAALLEPEVKAEAETAPKSSVLDRFKHK